MKINHPVSGREVNYGDHISIISMTNAKGIISYVNKDFIDISGFTEQELLGKNHNIVRHPDMPPAAFKDLWQTVQAGNPWQGMVKNRCKNGDHYWVEAFVTPIVKRGQVVGYQSVRTKPSREQVAAAESLYARVNSHQLSDLPKPKRLWALSLQQQVYGLLMLVGLSGVVGGGYAASLGGHLALSVVPAGLSLLLMLAGVLLMRAKVLMPLAEIRRAVKEIGDGNLDYRLQSATLDELGKLKQGVNMLRARFKTVVGHIAESSEDLSAASSELAVSAEQADKSMHQQSNETDQVATAMQEMAATVQEVAQSTASAAAAAQESSEKSGAGRAVVESNISSIHSLAEQVAQAAEVITELERDAGNISTILDVIRGVAEQTNLLALNAAIEAARAGEQGRGFAVVADEVRTLAKRTQDSTAEIQQLIEKLQMQARRSVDVMDKGSAQASRCVEEASQTTQVLSEIDTAVQVIVDMNNQVATASEEQSSVAEEISRNITNIRDLSDQTGSAVRMVASRSAKLNDLSEKLRTLVAELSN